MDEEGLGENDQPATAVYAAAVTKLKNDADFRQKLTQIETHYSKSTLFLNYSLRKVQIKTPTEQN